MTHPPRSGQLRVPAAFYRGGTSRAVLFRADDLAGFGPAERDEVILAALGSPDPYGRQVDGLGGGISSLSKAAIIGRAPAGADYDVMFHFAQVDVERPLVEFKGNCGNISAAVGPFAVEEGLVPPVEPLTRVRALSANTGQRFDVLVPVRDGAVAVEGDYAIDGVPGTGARIEVELLDPGGSLGRGLLPTGAPRERLGLADGRAIEASIVDAANPMVFVRAADLDATATELPAVLDARAALVAALEAVRAAAAVRLGLAATPEEAAERVRAVPKVALVAPPADYATTRGTPVAAAAVDLVARMLSMGKTHRTYALTAGVCTAVAAALPGTLVAEACRPPAGAERVVRIGHPAGVLDVAVRLAPAPAEPGGWRVLSATYGRTARRIMDGWVLVPPGRLGGSRAAPAAGTALERSAG